MNNNQTANIGLSLNKYNNTPTAVMIMLQNNQKS